MNVLWISILIFAGHLAWAGNRIFDLFTKSQRKNKVQWMLLILLVPFMGSIVYNLTMKRIRYHL